MILVLLTAALLGGCAGISAPSRAPDAVKAMTTTGYCSCGECCGWYRTWYLAPVEKATGRSKRVGQTASGSQARYGTIAAPSDYPFGTIVHIEGYGYGRVEDRGGLIKGNKLDLFFNSHRQARNWGKRQRTVKIWFPDKRAGGSSKPTPPPSGVGAKLRK